MGHRRTKNVTVITKSPKYIVIMHSIGMNTVKLTELSPEQRTQLGYKAAVEAQPQKTSSPLALSTCTKQLEKKWHAYAPPSLAYATLTPNLITSICWELALLYLLMCYCSMLICNKCGYPPGVLVWIPVLQLIPLLRAAGMSPAWFLAFLIPVLNIIAQIVWSVNIAKARGKSPWVGLLLALPLTTLFAYLYLALSGQAAQKKDPAAAIMTLEAA